MPELTKEHLPKILKKNNDIKYEVQSIANSYKSNYHLRGWSTIEGAKKWIEGNHFLIQAPIKDPSCGGFIFYRKDKHICYINTWQPRVYQNFVLLHELYHIMLGNEGNNCQKAHFVSSELTLNQEERKADYFASILLLEESLLRQFFASLGQESFEYKIFQIMHSFSAPYKAILIRLFELELICEKELTAYFDKRYDFELQFKKYGIDPFQIQKSLVIKFDNLEKSMKLSNLPEVAQESNQKVYEEVFDYFRSIKPN